ncbi:LacI family DNA-binding transcriptional regulator [uncultured Friedmanniella sp.]|uniref:LacI family DNA-binding transcriptional regulator n=1 Tax=uncultured Friedmanniella sp. TaxID=335381 RepID=UPI0035CB647A
MTDVARKAEVSLGTVSKALSGQGQLAADTRSRVLRAAKELGFTSTRPHSSTGFTIGVLSTDHVGRFSIPILEGAEDALGAVEGLMILCESRGDPIRERHYVRALQSRHVDGILVTGRSSDVRPSLGARLTIPTVYALARSVDHSDLSVTHDDEGGAALAVAHLLDTGRHQVALVGGAARHIATRNRERGALRSLAEAGVAPVLGGTLYGEWSEQWGREAVATLLRAGAAFDGVFCFSDQIARGALDALRENGMDVPGTVGVVGVDNWSVMAEAARPPLTTVDLALHSIGRTAASRLLAIIAGEPRPTGVELVPCGLVRRAST